MNFFFTVPRLTLRFFDRNYIVTFPVMFLVAVFSGTLAVRLKENARQSANAAFRTRILLETDQLLQKQNSAENVRSVARLLGHIFDLGIQLPSDAQKRLSKCVNPQILPTIPSVSLLIE